MNNIELELFEDTKDNYDLLFKWCSKKDVYEWFEQRVLSYDEIVIKYKNKISEGKQKLYLITCDSNPIGLIQLYKYADKPFDNMSRFNNIYEYDLFIGEDEYLSRGIGSKVIDNVDNMLFNEYYADCTILRPFKRNERAIKCYLKSGYKEICEYDGKDTLGNKERIVVLIKTKQS